MRPILALIKKDLRLHGRGLLASWGLWAALALALVSVMPRQTPDARYQVAFNLSTVGSVLYGQWLIDREKARRTLAWLRSLPISDAHIVAAKILTLTLFQCGLFGVLLAVCAPSAPSRFGLLDVVQKVLILEVFATWLLAGKWLLGERLGQAISAAAFLVVLVLAAYSHERFAAVAGLLDSRAGTLAVSAALLASLFAVAVILIRMLSRQDTSQWIR